VIRNPLPSLPLTHSFFFCCFDTFSFLFFLFSNNKHKQKATLTSFLSVIHPFFFLILLDDRHFGGYITEGTSEAAQLKKTQFTKREKETKNKKKENRCQFPSAHSNL